MTRTVKTFNFITEEDPRYRRGITRYRREQLNFETRRIRRVRRAFVEPIVQALS